MNLPRVRGVPHLKQVTAISFLTILIVGGPSSTTVLSSQVATQTGNSPYSYQDYGLSALGLNDSVSLPLLQSLLQSGQLGSTSVSNLERYIKVNLLALNVRRVLLDIGWQNYTIGRIPHETWVDNWLSACDSLGVENVLLVGQLTKMGVGSPWVTSLIEADPSVQTYSPDGKSAMYVSPDNRDFVNQLEHDLETIHSYYGGHPSWVGIGTGSTVSDPYFGSSSTMPVLGYSNATLANFVSSGYFASDVSPTGYDQTGVLDLLWAEFKGFAPSVLLSSGNWQLSVPVSVYGSSSNGSSLAMKFYLPENQSAITIEWYGSRPGPASNDMKAEVLNDSAGMPLTQAVVSSQTEVAGSITTTSGWQGPVRFQGAFTKGYYWFYLASPSTNESASYQIYVRNYPVDNFFAQTMGKSSGGRWSNVGQSIIWIRGANGSSLVTYPYEQPLVVPAPQQSFTADSSFAFNSVYLFLSDRHFDSTNGTLTIVDRTVNSTVAIGLLSQALTHGLQNWTPIPLNQSVVTQKGHRYVMTISEPHSGFSWIVALRGLTASPPESGFQGQSRYWLFRLALVNWGPSHLDFTADVSNGIDAVSPGHPDAVSFTATNSLTGQVNISRLSVFIDRASHSNKTYEASVNLTVSIHANDPRNGTPARTILQTLDLPGSSIPQGAWLNVTGFNVSLVPGQTYWAVFSTESPGARFPMARLVSPYNLRVLVSRDGGSSWSNPAEGPTEFSLSIGFSDGSQLGNLIQEIPEVQVDATNFFAQPFRASSSTEATGVLVGPIIGTRNPNDFILVSLSPDNGRGEPSGETLATGRLFSGNITLNYGLQFIQFTSAVRLQEGRLYWIVIRGGGVVRGGFAVKPVIYSYEQKGMPSSMTSRNAGYSWARVSNQTSVLSFRIETPLFPLPSYSTAELYADLATIHNKDPRESPRAGWGSYVQSLEMETEANLTDWLQTKGNAPTIFYGTGTPSILASLSPRSFVSTPPDRPMSTCHGLETYLLSVLPSVGQQLPTVNNLGLMRRCFSNEPNNLLSQLSYLRYEGPHFGLSTNRSVLFLSDVPSDLRSRYLLVSYNVAYFDFSSNEDQAVAAVDGAYKVVVVASGSNTSERLELSLKEFVMRGGTLVNLGSIPNWLDSFISLFSKGPGIDRAQFQRIVGLWTRNTALFHTLNVESSGNLLLADGHNLTLGLARIAKGEVVVVYQANQSATFQGSDATIVLSNVVGSAFSPNSASPFWQASSSESSTSLVYSIEGTSNGRILFWVSNPSETDQRIAVSLNASYYRLPQHRKILDLSTLNVTTSQGEVVKLETVVRAMSWVPMIVLPDDASLRGDYSSIAIVSDLRYPNQALITAGSPSNQSAMMVLSSNSTVRNVLLDNTYLQMAGSVSQVSKGSVGWYYDHTTRTLFVKWVSDIKSRLRLEYAGVPTSPPPVLPVGLFVTLTAIAIVAELLILAYLRTLHKSFSGPSTKDNKVATISLDCIT